MVDIKTLKECSDRVDALHKRMDSIESRKDADGHVVKRYAGGVKLLEGAGRDGGSWFMQDRKGKWHRFKNRDEAERECEAEAED